MKLGIFADPHWCGQDVLCKTRRPRLSLAKMQAASEAFAKAGVDLILCMGDLVDPEETHEAEIFHLKTAFTLFQSTEAPFLLVPGNHDYHVFGAGEMEELVGFRIPPYRIDVGGVRLIILDANYRSNGRRYDIAGVEWRDTNLPQEQLDFLQGALHTSSLPCVVAVHEVLDPTVRQDHVIRNAEAARSIIRKNGKVRLVLQGHYHAGADSLINGIPYLTVPAMCEGTENHFLILDL